MRKLLLLFTCFILITRLHAQSGNNGMDTLKQGLRNIGNLFKKAATVTFIVNGIDNSDKNLVLLKKNIQQSINVKKVEDSYLQNVTTLKVSYKGKATDLWQSISANTKQVFNVNSINDSIINLNYRFAKTETVTPANTNSGNNVQQQNVPDKVVVAAGGNSNDNGLSRGAALLFKNTKTKLTNAQKNIIFDSLKFTLSKDEKQFILNNESADYPFDAFAYPTDLNKDGKEEIFISFGNSFTSGMAGSSILVFIADKSGTYKMNLGFPGLLPDALTTINAGYPDLLIGGPGMEFPVWRWNGKEYIYFKSVKDADYSKIKKMNIEDVSKAYISGINTSQ